MMRSILLFVLAAFISSQLHAQGQYQVLVEKPNEKSLKGIISKEILLSDTSFHWYAENLKGYAPNALAVSALKKQKDSIQLLVFMGTWCDDSHFIIPKFYTLLDAASFPLEKVTLLGVD